MGLIQDSILASGCIINGATVFRSILSNGIVIGKRCFLRESILFPNVTLGEGCRLNRVIVDDGVELPKGMRIGFNRVADRRRFQLADEGIIVVTKEHIEKLKK